MSEIADPLVLDFVEWIAREPRFYAEVVATWRTSCPRLTIWEDASDRGSVVVHEVDERGVIDGVVFALFGGRDFCVIDLVGVRRAADRVRAAGQPDQARMEQLYIFGQMLARVALGVDGDEQRLHIVGIGA